MEGGLIVQTGGAGLIVQMGRWGWFNSVGGREGLV